MKVVSRRRRLEAAGATAVFVAYDSAEALGRGMLSGVDSPYPVVVDESRRSYDAWGLTRAPWWRIWLDPNVWRQYRGLLASGERLSPLGRDTRQLGGDFVVGAAGRLVYARPQQRDDRPPVGELLDALESAAGGR